MHKIEILERPWGGSGDSCVLARVPAELLPSSIGNSVKDILEDENGNKSKKTKMEHDRSYVIKYVTGYSKRHRDNMEKCIIKHVSYLIELNFLLFNSINNKPQKNMSDNDSIIPVPMHVTRYDDNKKLRILMTDLKISFPIHYASLRHNEIEQSLLWLANFHSKYWGLRISNQDFLSDRAYLWKSGTYWSLEKRLHEYSKMIERWDYFFNSDDRESEDCSMSEDTKSFVDALEYLNDQEFKKVRNLANDIRDIALPLYKRLFPFPINVQLEDITHSKEKPHLLKSELSSSSENKISNTRGYEGQSDHSDDDDEEDEEKVKFMLLQGFEKESMNSPFIPNDPFEEELVGNVLSFDIESTSHEFFFTLLHGDYKSENIFFKNDHANEAAVCDFQWCGAGLGAQDVMHFILTCLSSSDDFSSSDGDSNDEYVGESQEADEAARSGSETDKSSSKNSSLTSNIRNLASEEYYLRFYHSALNKNLNKKKTQNSEKEIYPWSLFLEHYELSMVDYCRYLIGSGNVFSTDVDLIKRVAVELIPKYREILCEKT